MTELYLGDGLYASFDGYQVRLWTDRFQQCSDERALLRGALLKACSMLDDAVQLRDDAAQWFPLIAALRKVAQP